MEFILEKRQPLLTSSIPVQYSHLLSKVKTFWPKSDQLRDIMPYDIKINYDTISCPSICICMHIKINIKLVHYPHWLANVHVAWS